VGKVRLGIGNRDRAEKMNSDEVKQTSEAETTVRSTHSRGSTEYTVIRLDLLVIMRIVTSDAHEMTVVWY
jgi:hypothetical protein